MKHIEITVGEYSDLYWEHLVVPDDFDIEAVCRAFRAHVWRDGEPARYSIRDASLSGWFSQHGARDPEPGELVEWTGISIHDPIAYSSWEPASAPFDAIERADFIQVSRPAGE